MSILIYFRGALFSFSLLTFDLFRGYLFFRKFVVNDIV